jgi:hypothetical protein
LGDNDFDIVKVYFVFIAAAQRIQNNGERFRGHVHTIAEMNRAVT